MRGVAAAAACLLLVVAGGAASAHAGVAAACPGTSSGVTVVVDFSGVGGGVEIGCAPGNPSTGLAALQGAGFGWTGTARFPTFVCRIDGLPTPDQDRCVNTPPATEYWGYWYAERGGSWSYSSSGAASRNPEPGDVDGWAFGAGVQPGTAPPAAPAPPPPREDPPDDPPDDPPRAEDPSEPDRPGGAGEPDQPDEPGGEAAAPDSEEPPSPGPGSPAPTPPGTSASAPAPPAAPVNPVARTTSGSPVGVVVGLGLVVVLGAAAVLVNRRRTRT